MLRTCPRCGGSVENDRSVLYAAYAPYRSVTALLSGRGDVIRGSLQEVSLAPSSFDVVTLWDLLEHIPDPRSLMGRAASLLKPDGYLFVNVPDLDSLPTRLLRARWPLLLPEHLIYFSRESLRLCGESAGLSLIRFGRRLASFSVGYLLRRLAEHRVTGAAGAARLARWCKIEGMVVSIPLGELCGIRRRHAHAPSRPRGTVDRGHRS